MRGGGPRYFFRMVLVVGLFYHFSIQRCTWFDSFDDYILYAWCNCLLLLRCCCMVCLFFYGQEEIVSLYNYVFTLCTTNPACSQNCNYKCDIYKISPYNIRYRYSCRPAQNQQHYTRTPQPWPMLQALHLHAVIDMTCHMTWHDMLHDSVYWQVKFIY